MTALISSLMPSLALVATAVAEEAPKGPGETILGHVVDSDPAIFGITKAVILMAIAAVLVLFGVRRALAGYDADGVPRTRWSQMVDPFVEHFYRDIAVHYIGEKFGKKVAPLLLTFFFFILTCNLMGLVPVTEMLELGAHGAGIHLSSLVEGGGTATANWNITLTLAVITFVAIIIFGSMKHGVVGHFAHLAPKGLPFPVRWFLLLPIEIISMFVKPIALTMRLAANMSGGHIAVLALLFIPIMTKSAFVAGIPAVLVATGVMLLEIIVCFVQAYVFALLSGVFIGLAVHSHH